MCNQVWSSMLLYLRDIILVLHLDRCMGPCAGIMPFLPADKKQSGFWIFNNIKSDWNKFVMASFYLLSYSTILKTFIDINSFFRFSKTKDFLKNYALFINDRGKQWFKYLHSDLLYTPVMRLQPTPPTIFSLIGIRRFSFVSHRNDDQNCDYHLLIVLNFYFCFVLMKICLYRFLEKKKEKKKEKLQEIHICSVNSFLKISPFLLFFTKYRTEISRKII